MAISDSSRDCLRYIVRSGLMNGFNRGDIPHPISFGIHGLSRCSFIKKNKSGNYHYTLTIEGKKYIKLQRLE